MSRMENAVIVRGRVVSPTQIELLEALPPEVTDVQVIARQPADAERAASPTPTRTLRELLRDLPPGNRSQADIDEQIRQERAQWDD